MPPVERDDLIMALMKDIDPEKDPELWQETLDAFEKASDRELDNWYNQQNDPQQARENAWSSEVHATNTDLSQHSSPEMSEADREAIMAEIASDLDLLQQELGQDQDLNQEQEQEHEQ